jgi:hypothetical protein
MNNIFSCRLSSHIDFYLPTASGTLDVSCRVQDKAQSTTFSECSSFNSTRDSTETVRNLCTSDKPSLILSISTQGSGKMATTIRLASPAKLWRSYLAALELHPIRTKVLTSTTLFVTGDAIAQLAIEQRQLGLDDRIRDAGVIKDVRNLYDVSIPI